MRKLPRSEINVGEVYANPLAKQRRGGQRPTVANAAFSAANDGTKDGVTHDGGNQALVAELRATVTALEAKNARLTTEVASLKRQASDAAAAATAANSGTITVLPEATALKVGVALQTCSAASIATLVNKRAQIERSIVAASAALANNTFPEDLQLYKTRLEHAVQQLQEHLQRNTVDTDATLALTVMISEEQALAVALAAKASFAKYVAVALQLLRDEPAAFARLAQVAYKIGRAFV